MVRSFVAERNAKVRAWASWIVRFHKVMDRDGQVSIQTKGIQWTTKGIKMSRAQIKRQIEQQISDTKK